MRSQDLSALLESQRNLVRYSLAARPAIIAFVKQKFLEFRTEGGRFHAPKIMRGFASFNAATKIINLSRSPMADAKLAAVVEELIHFQQAQEADVFGKEGGWFSRYTSEAWLDLAPILEAEVDEIMLAMGFVE